MKSKLLAILAPICGCFLGVWIGIWGWDTSRGGPIGMTTSTLFCTVMGFCLTFGLWPNTDRWRKYKRKKRLKHRIKSKG